MIFKKNKPSGKASQSPSAPRGRDTAAGSSPLARRFADEEPDTIDLRGPAGFPDDEAGFAGDGEPDTRVAGAAPVAGPAPTGAGVISRDVETGKFYVLPGTPDAAVTLNGEPVGSPTEFPGT